MRLRTILLKVAHKVISDSDPSHDILHSLRVLGNGEHIAAREGGDLDIIRPGCLLHDVRNYPKDDPRAKYSAIESAIETTRLLRTIPAYPRHKIRAVYEAIEDHSFSNGRTPRSLEGKIIQDADRLDQTGAVAIMRTFASAGQMKRPFYDPKDLSPKTDNRHAINLFYSRLLIVGDKMNTETARQMARQRTEFLQSFLKQFYSEVSY